MDRPKNPMAAFLQKSIDNAEKTTNMFSNTVKTADKLSSGLLVFDWLAGGGFTNFTIISGEEQSSKTTHLFHIEASAIKQNLPYVTFIDTEGTLDIDYGSSIWSAFDVDMKAYLDDKTLGFRYYRNRAIERVFDYLVSVINDIPDKFWYPAANTWAYVLPKHDKYFAEMKSAMGWKEDKTLSNQKQYVIPTDDASMQGFIGLDSFAAMLTNKTEDEEMRSNRMSMEASAFSEHLKRLVGKLPDKQIGLFGTNQLRDDPGAAARSGGRGSPEMFQREPGGKALQFYSAVRFRTYSRVSDKAWPRDPKNYQHSIEPSVEGEGMDRYATKEVKNTKNKLGRPLLKSRIRVWVSDTNGRGRGIDPVYDTYQHLLNTGQITVKNTSSDFVSKGKIAFRLLPSVGKIAGILNEHEISYMTFKKLIIGEVNDDIELMKDALYTDMNLSVKIMLRQRLFIQLRKDRSLWSDHVSMDAQGSADENDDNFDDEEETTSSKRRHRL